MVHEILRQQLPLKFTIAGYYVMLRNQFAITRAPILVRILLAHVASRFAKLLALWTILLAQLNFAPVAHRASS